MGGLLSFYHVLPTYNIFETSQQLNAFVSLWLRRIVQPSDSGEALIFAHPSLFFAIIQMHGRRMNGLHILHLQKAAV
jgi:hypothetical protein